MYILLFPPVSLPCALDIQLQDKHTQFWDFKLTQTPFCCLIHECLHPLTSSIDLAVTLTPNRALFLWTVRGQRQPGSVCSRYRITCSLTLEQRWRGGTEPAAAELWNWTCLCLSLLMKVDSTISCLYKTYIKMVIWLMVGTGKQIKKLISIICYFNQFES